MMNLGYVQCSLFFITLEWTHIMWTVGAQCAHFVLFLYILIHTGVIDFFCVVFILFGTQCLNLMICGMW